MFSECTLEPDVDATDAGRWADAHGPKSASKPLSRRIRAWAVGRFDQPTRDIQVMHAVHISYVDA